MITLPTLSEIYTNVRADLDAEFGINISLKKKVALRAYAAVHAGKIWGTYKVLGFVQKNVWPDTADTEAKGGTLERFGRVRLGRNPDQAVAGQYTVTVTGTIGAVIKATQTFKSDDDSLSPGYLFILDSEHTMVSASDSIVLRALTPGTEAALEVGDTLTATSPIALVNSTATVSAETVQPLAAETTEDYREKVVQSFRIEAQGGSPGDYRIWASDAQGVEKVYPYAKSGETNSNNIYVEATIADSTDGKGTPSQSILDDVEEVCEQSPDTTLTDAERSRRPLGVVNYFLPITPLDVDIEIVGFTGITAAQQTLIENAIEEALSDVRPFIAGVDSLATKNDILDKNKINAIIYSQIPGAVYTSINLEVSSVALDTYTFSGGNIPYLNSVIYS
jgi:uncharacterized phage protein gp47/JayE